MSKNKKVVKYRKPVSINIGVVIFGIIFVYLVFNVYTYMTTTHVSFYEVKQGTMAENNIYNGLILRDEQIYNSDYSGALNFYVKETSKVSYNNLIYSVDESGDISRMMEKAGRDVSKLDAASLEEIRETISDFQTTYEPLDFYNVHSFKENMESTLTEALNLDVLNYLSETAQGQVNDAGFHRITSNDTGIIVYYSDGYEDVTPDTFTADMFQESAYSRTSSRKNTSVKVGEPVYKLINSEIWNIVVPISPELAKRLAADDVIQIRFVKDGKKAYATYELVKKSGGDYLVLTLKNSMVRYAKDRYVEVELLLTEETGLKIPNSAITEKEFYTVPIKYFMKGGDSDKPGLLVEHTDSNGKTSTEFVAPAIYCETKKYYYIDSEDVSVNDKIIKSNSSETYRIGSDTASLKGVYNINKGYAVFKRIKILYQNEEYTIVESGTNYGITLYDHIALDSTKVNENELIK